MACGNFRLRREMVSLPVELLAASCSDFSGLMRSRLAWVEQQPDRPGLVHLEDKLASRTWARKAEVPVPKLLGSWQRQSREALEVLLGKLQVPFAVKPTHLLAGRGVLFVTRGGAVMLPPPSGPGAAVMQSWQSKHRDVEGHVEVARLLQAMLDEPAGPSEAKPLRSVLPRVMAEEKVDVKLELRVLVVFGDVIAAAHDGNQYWQPGTRAEEEMWTRMKAASERYAGIARSDILRLDFFVLDRLAVEQQEFVLCETCAFLWPGDGFFSDSVYSQAAAKLSQAYGALAQPTLTWTREGDRLWRFTENYAAIDPRYQTQWSNFYAVRGDHTVAFIDSGHGLHHVRTLAEQVLGCSCEDRVLVVLTHWHSDHIGGAGALECYAHPAEAACIVEGPDLSDLVTSPSEVGRELSQESARDPGSRRPRAVRSVEEGQIIDLGGVQLRILHTPGHTEGHISVIAGSDLFTGDSFIEGMMFVTDASAFCSSLQRLEREAIAANLTIWPGHEATRLPAHRLVHAREACEQMLQDQLLSKSKEAVRAPVAPDSGRWVEWDDFLDAPIAQVGDFAFAKFAGDCPCCR